MMKLVMRILRNLLLHGKLTEYSEKIAALNQKYPGEELFVFYATKPFQYVSLKNTGGLKNGNCNILLMSSLFINSEDFQRKIKEHDGHLWKEIIFLPDHVLQKDIFLGILQLHNLKEFWSGTDAGYRPAVFFHSLKQQGTKVCVYEEGLGNYVIRKFYGLFPGQKPGLFNLIFVQTICLFLKKLLGSTYTIGGCKWNDEVYLNYPEYPGLLPCVKAKAKGMSNGVVDHWKEQTTLFEIEKLPMFQHEISNKNILVISTNWDPVYEITESDREKYDLFVIKFHPHIKEDQGVSPDPRIIHLQTDIPAEVVLLYLLKNNKVTFRSEFSSTMIYMFHSEIEMEFMGKNPPRFLEDVFLYTKNLPR